MLHAILTDPDNGYLYIRADGELTHDNFANFTPALEELVKSDVRKLPVMIELGTDFQTDGMKGLWHALKLDHPSQSQRFSRIAVVADSDQDGVGSGASKPSFDVETRFFAHAKRANAEQWLLGQPMTEIP